MATITSSPCCGTLTALQLQTPETAHSEETRTEGNSGRRDFFS